jgi:hypothetical protein
LTKGILNFAKNPQNAVFEFIFCGKFAKLVEGSVVFAENPQFFLKICKKNKPTFCFIIYLCPVN